MSEFDDFYLPYKEDGKPIPDTIYEWLKEAYVAGRRYQQEVDACFIEDSEWRDAMGGTLYLGWIADEIRKQEQE